MQDSPANSHVNTQEVKLSIIIPMAPTEPEPVALLADLKRIPDEASVEIILARNPLGRAATLNTGARQATGTHLWFLHADSRLDKSALEALYEEISKGLEEILYFELAFIKGSLWLMHFNACGANFRSHVLKTPFGDQGFCMSREVFERLGFYREDAPYGEDHLLIRQAARLGIRVRSVHHRIYTSARKYEQNGWLKTNILHLYLWRKQALSDRHV